MFEHALLATREELTMGTIVFNSSVAPINPFTIPRKGNRVCAIETSTQVIYLPSTSDSIIYGGHHNAKLHIVDIRGLNTSRGVA
jgi:hypothetical protein